MKSQRHLFIKKTLLFILIIVCCDLLGGQLARYLYFSQKSGRYYQIIYSLEHTSTPILIFGSSHASRHYVPEIFEQELGMPCHNAGVKGQDILFISTIEKIILKRYHPKLLILNIDTDWLYVNQESYERLAELYPFYYKFKEEIKPAVLLKSKFASLMLLSKFYQYNSTIIHIIASWFVPQTDYNGYLPLFGEMTKPPDDIGSIRQKTSTKEKEIDQHSVNALIEFIESSQKVGSKLIFVVSPSPYEVDMSDDKSFQLIRQIANSYKVPLIDYHKTPIFVQDYSLYHDYAHLNHKGATIFSKIVANDIKQKLGL